MNLAMQRKVDDGDAVDVSEFDFVNHTPDPLIRGTVDLTNELTVEEIRDGERDFCDLGRGRWVWSIGRRHSDGRVFAAFDARFYQRAGFECIWLR